MLRSTMLTRSRQWLLKREITTVGGSIEIPHTLDLEPLTSAHTGRERKRVIVWDTLNQMIVKMTRPYRLLHCLV
jgi:hypothetical protein